MKTKITLALFCLPLFLTNLWMPGLGQRRTPAPANVCGCKDKGDLENRYNEATAAIAEYKKQIAALVEKEKAGGEKIMATKGNYKEDKDSLQNRVQLMINAVTKPGTNRPSSETNGTTCETSFESSATPCMRESRRLHEGVHRRVCLNVGEQTDILLLKPNYFQKMRLADLAMEEIEAYDTERAFLIKQIRELPATCQVACDGQWHGTIIYTKIFTSTSKETTSPPSPRPAASSDGGYENQDWTVTQSGTITVNGNNEALANSSADEIFVDETFSSGKAYCHGGLGGPKGPLVPGSSTHSETRYGSGKSQGKVTAQIILHKEDYEISIKPPNINGTLQSTTRSSYSGGCPPTKPSTSFSHSSNKEYGSSDYISGRANYGADRNFLSGSETKTTSTPLSSRPTGGHGSPTSTITGSITTTTIITWNLRRCN